jgi:hypothetical protein
MQNIQSGFCAYCGADAGLHHYETQQCPLAGLEETRAGRQQQWLETTFTDSGEKQLADTAPQLLAALLHAKNIIKKWHGPFGWNIYDSISPEMKDINAAIKEATKFSQVKLQKDAR